MFAYYNEHDPKAAAWLRELINQGHIAPGVVDERSIEDVKPYELEGFTQCHFFAGIGGWSLALRRAGWPDDRPVWTGSCPCQSFSAAGQGAGFADERHLWPAWQHLINQRQPSHIFGEQVASQLALSWLDLVQADLEAAGYACGAVDLCAAGVGAPHIRQRLWFVAERLADAQRANEQQRQKAEREPEPTGGGIPERPTGPTKGTWRDADWLFCRDGKWRPVEPGAFPLAHGVPARVGLLRGYGNAINVEVAAEVIRAYMESGA